MMMKKGFLLVISLLAIIALLWVVATLAVPARADDPYSQSPYKGWADQQEVTQAARPRFGCTSPGGRCSCCADAEIVATRFRVDRGTGADQWWYLHQATNQWRRVPEDVIHWGEHSPDGRPVLFIWSGEPRCFFPGEDGG